ncbi:MAG: phosphotransferase [Oscillospiraceae bacterium]|nr:phosphotransferase [Oscillospiraceae bacterium]
MLKTVAELYRITPGKLIRLTGGDKNIVYKIKDRDLVIRIYQPTAPLDGIAFEHAFMDVLSGDMDQVVKPLYYKPEKSFFMWDGRPVAVLPYIHGKTPGQKDCEDTAFCYAAGHMLGRIHRLGTENIYRLPELRSRIPIAQMEPFDNYLFDWEKGCAWLSETELSPEIPYMKNQLEELYVYIKEQTHIPFIPIHGDYYRGNLLWDGKNITGIIDFDDARMEWAEFEVARSLWEFAGNNARVVMDEACQEAYLAGYSAANPAVRHEMGLYRKIMKLVRLLEIVSTAASMVTGDLLGDWDRDYHWRNLLWCKKL